MSVYPPSGSGGAHMDKAISGKKHAAAKTAKTVPVKTAKKSAPAKKAKKDK